MVLFQKVAEYISGWIKFGGDTQSCDQLGKETTDKGDFGVCVIRRRRRDSWFWPFFASSTVCVVSGLWLAATNGTVEGEHK